LPVFVDGRSEMYGNRFEFMAVDVLLGHRAAQPVLDEYGINLVLVRRELPIAVTLRRDAVWQLAYEDSLSSVFVRAAGTGS
jgi:hypothetical protein